MFSFLKRKILARDVADVFFDGIHQRADARHGERLQAHAPSLGHEIVNDEWIYFDVFTFDYATFLAFGETPARQAVLDPFSFLVAAWLKTRQAPPTPIRTTLYLFPGELTTLFPEGAEPAHERLKRRLALYAKAVKAPSEFAGNDKVAHAFSTLCGVRDISFDGGVAAGFSTLKIEYVKILKSVRIK
jgi:hypothetical protein